MSKTGALDVKSRLKEMKAQSSNKLILGHLHINLIRNKFEASKFIVDHNIDIFLISEIKLDDSFPTAYLLIKDLTAPYRFDRILRAADFSFIPVEIYCLRF